MDVPSTDARRGGLSSRALSVALSLALSLFACNKTQPLSNSRPSPSALAEAVLNALAQRDEAALRALALDESEFREHVWPALPAARPERNLPFSYVWGELRQKSDTSLVSTLKKYGGRRYALVDVRFGEAPAEYAGYRVHPTTTFVVRSENGADETVRLCGSFLEKGGLWKVFSYVVDD